jgi:hypothetical protein
MLVSRTTGHRFNNSADGFAMSITSRFSGSVLVLLAIATLGQAGERPTLNFHTADPRPDILPHPIYNAYTPFRLRYNRPRFLTGWLAAQIEPTSQEAMVWAENLQVGNYDRKHTPPMYKRYYYPKPWEVLLTGPRPDFPNAKQLKAAQEETEFNLEEMELNNVLPTDRSASDR